MATGGKPINSGLAVGTRSGNGHLKAGVRSCCLTRTKEEGTRTVVLSAYLPVGFSVT